jgi:Na+-translocating ferredoxin:NAD+ oxidoreductase RNF subunit RnfB
MAQKNIIFSLILASISCKYYTVPAGTAGNDREKAAGMIENNPLFIFLKVRRVESLLPGTNCTACGAVDCASFARMIVQDNADAARCAVCDSAMIQRIREHLHRA